MTQQQVHLIDRAANGDAAALDELDRRNPRGLDRLQADIDATPLADILAPLAEPLKAAAAGDEQGKDYFRQVADREDRGAMMSDAEPNE